MRQAGFLAAGGLYALKNNVERLKEDHKRAKELEACLVQLNWIKEVIPVQTNIVVAVLNRAEDRDLYINKLKERDILVMAFGEGMIRLVTHLNNSDSDIEKTCSILKSF